jgi:hypothetical protein
MNQTTVDRKHEDLHWATHDPDVLDRYAGQYVVPFERQIVAHGPDLGSVLAEAARRTGKETWELVFCAIQDPLEDISH